MIKKVGSIFKKGSNDWLKITVSIVISAVMVIFFSKAVASSYAAPTELPDSLTTGMGDILTDRVNLFDGLDGDEIIALVPYYAYDGSNRYTVYCLEKEKGWPSNDSPQTITKSEVPLDSGYVYILQNGYPNKSLTGNNKNDDYLTQVAIWFYQDRVNGVSDSETGVLTANQKSVIKSSSYYRYIEPLITGAVNAKNNPETINPTFSIDSSDFKLSSDNRYLITDVITVSSNIEYNNYSVSVDNNAVEVLDSSNNVVEGSIDSSEGFKLRVDLSKIDNPINVNINVIVNYIEYVAYSYNPPKGMEETMQQSVVGTLVGVPKQKTITNRVGMPSGSLTIRKVDSSDNSPLAGASIEVIRKVTNKTVASFESTTSDYVIDNLLPGEYEIKETSAPNGYYIDEESSTVIINESNLNVSKTITNSKFDVRIRKVDKETGKVVSGAVLNILDSSNRVVETITTTEDYVSITDLGAGRYKVVEVKAPEGYLINEEEKEFVLDKENSRVTVDFEDEKNEVIIEKKDAESGSIISGAVLRLIKVSDNSIIDEWTSDNKGHSVKGLVPGEYKVIEVSAPDGYTLSSSEVPVTITGEETEPITVTFYNSDNQITITKVDKETKESISGAKLKITNSNGDEIDTFTTTNEPYTLDKLDPGTYYVEELEAPSGYVPLKEKQSFNVDENSSGIQVTIENVKTEMSLGKVDASTGEYISGATLRLTDSNGEEVETFVSSNTPYVIKGLPYGIYHLEEVEAPLGYIKTDEKVDIDFNSNTTANIYTISNTTGGLTIQKIDSETGKAVSGATLEIRDSNGDTVKTIITTDRPTVISDLSDGTYKVVEVKAPDGYIKNNKEYEVVINASNPNPSIIIENEPITVNLGKIDARTGEYISGATMRLSRLDGEMEPITFVSTNSPYKVMRLSPGIYSLEELEAPVGYVGTGSTLTFEVLETGKVQSVNISNDITTISINNRRLVVEAESGYKFRLERRSGEVVEEFETTDDGYTSRELEIGDYTLKQIETPDGVIVNDKEIYFSVGESNEVNVVNFVNDFTKVNISKKDMANSEEIEGAHLVIRDSNGEVVEEWTSSNSPHYIEKLPVGRYTLTETMAPEGYIINTSVIDFEVLETGEIQSEVMFNSKPIEVPNTSRNATYIYLVGGILIIIGGVLIYISYKNKIRVISK